MDKINNDGNSKNTCELIDTSTVSFNLTFI